MVDVKMWVPVAMLKIVPAQGLPIRLRIAKIIDSPAGRASADAYTNVSDCFTAEVLGIY